MRSKIFLPFLFTLSACGADPDIGGGFELVDGGGSKLSLAKDGLVVINYTVTGLGRIANNVIIESKDYNLNQCKYFIINVQTQEMVELSQTHSNSSVALRDAQNIIEPLNQRSCKN